MQAVNPPRKETTPEIYERMLVPAIFDGWTKRVTDAASIHGGQRVLDVACGTGVLARAAARRVSPGGAVSGLDLNPEMLAVARRLAPHIEWIEGDAGSLPWQDDQFDAVISQFGIMFFPDRVASLREMRRVLRPGGRLVVAVFDALERNPAYASMVDVLRRVVGDDAAAALSQPFVLGNPQELLGYFREAGFTSPAVETHRRVEVFESVRELIVANVDGWFPFAGIYITHEVLNTLIAETETALAAYVLPTGSIEYEVGAHIVSATATDGDA